MSYSNIHKGKDQLTALEVKETQSIANVRIHVERMTSMEQYSILQDTLPIDYVTTTCRSGKDCNFE